MTSTIVHTQTRDLVAAAVAVIPALAEAAPETLVLRRAVDSTVDALESAGLTSMSLPTHRGGSRACAATQFEVMAALAEGDAAVSWVASVYNAVGHMVCAFGDQALEEFAGSDMPRSAGVFALTGAAVEADGGHRVSGKWGFCSGQHHAGWVIVPALPEAGPPIAFLVPKSEFVVKDDWNVSGLVGTGSNTVVLDDVFVPGHRSIPFMDIVEGAYRTASLSGDSYYAQPFVPIMCALSVGTPIGLARAAVRLFKQRIVGRGITYTTYGNQAAAPVTHFQISDAQMKLDQAEFHAWRLVNTVDEHVVSGESWDIPTRVRCRADVAWALQLCREVCEIVEKASGASAIHARDPLGRILRDIRAISVHSFLLHSTNAELYGRVLAGQEPGVPFI